MERQRKYLVNLKQIIAKQRFFSPQPELNKIDNLIEETFNSDLNKVKDAEPENQ